MRVLVCAVAAFLAWKHFAGQGGLGFWPVALGLVAVLFNPVIPIHLTREIWAPIDVGAALVFGAHYAAHW